VLVTPPLAGIKVTIDHHNNITLLPSCPACAFPRLLWLVELEPPARGQRFCYFIPLLAHHADRCGSPAGQLYTNNPCCADGISFT